jgi:hypothetical protein
MAIKRVVVIGDTHCGHQAGLTPPMWQFDKDRSPVWSAIQKECWDWYKKTAKSLGDVYAVIYNGDAIDGNGWRNSGVEQITTDRIEQGDMAITCAKVFKPSNGFAMTFGTASHTGSAEDFEEHVARHLMCDIHCSANIEVDGVIFNTRHHCGSSGIPHGRHTAVAKERAWNIIKSVTQGEVLADIYLRSHVHYHAFCGGPDWLAMTLPALQTAGSKYGKRRCTGEVHFGFTHFDIEDGRLVGWKAHIINVQAAKSETVKL